MLATIKQSPRFLSDVSMIFPSRHPGGTSIWRNGSKKGKREFFRCRYIRNRRGESYHRRSYTGARERGGVEHDHGNLEMYTGAGSCVSCPIRRIAIVE